MSKAVEVVDISSSPESGKVGVSGDSSGRSRVSSGISSVDRVSTAKEKNFLRLPETFSRPEEETSNSLDLESICDSGECSSSSIEKCSEDMQILVANDRLHQEYCQEYCRELNQLEEKHKRAVKLLEAKHYSRREALRKRHMEKVVGIYK